MLKFLGTGSAFTKSKGNTAAYYYLEKSKILLIDCGESIFNKIVKNNILKNVNKIYILITHMHSDHVGSLGTLLFYCEYLEIETYIVFKELSLLKEVLRIYGINKKNHHLSKPKRFPEFHVKAYKQKHSKMVAYGYLLKIKDKTIYYSGDTSIIPKKVLKKIQEIDYFYQDVRLEPYPHHLNYEALINKIPPQYRHNVYCMHIPDNNDSEMFKKDGFNIAK